MFDLNFASKPTVLDAVIDDALAQLSGLSIDTDEYTRKVDQITKLYKLKEQEAPKRVSPDTLALVAGNLAGIMLMLHYERVHVITSKALGFVLKPR
jgi:hypothetical protein